MPEDDKSNFQRTPLIGRDDELARIDAILNREGPSLIFLIGEAGIGKTSFLREIEVRAAKDGWKTARSDSQGELSITPDTNEESFCKRIRELLNIPSDERLEEALDHDLTWTEDFFPIEKGKFPQILGKGSVQQTINIRTAKSYPSTGRPSDPKLGLEPFLSRDSTERLRRPNHARRVGLHPLAQQFRLQAPLVIMIDGYRPQSRFGEWFRDRFLENVKSTKERVVVIVAGEPGDTDMLGSTEDERITMGSLDCAGVRRYFEQISGEITPPLGTHELDEYVKDVCDKPEMLYRLTRLLKLIETNEGGI
ncbi:MAG: AAA family ATPase [Candidatus Hodarchaeota archaeon]